MKRDHLSAGFGVWAVRVYWKSVPQGDYSFGGFVFMLLAIFVFAIATGMAISLLAFVGKSLGKWGRLTAVTLSLVFLFF